MYATSGSYYTRLHCHTDPGSLAVLHGAFGWSKGGTLAPQDQFCPETPAETGLIADCHVLLLASKDVFHRLHQRFKELDPALIADCHVLPNGGEGCGRFPAPRFTQGPLYPVVTSIEAQLWNGWNFLG